MHNNLVTTLTELFDERDEPAYVSARKLRYEATAIGHYHDPGTSASDSELRATVRQLSETTDLNQDELESQLRTLAMRIENGTLTQNQQLTSNTQP